MSILQWSFWHTNLVYSKKFKREKGGRALSFMPMNKYLTEALTCPCLWCPCLIIAVDVPSRCLGQGGERHLRDHWWSLGWRWAGLKHEPAKCLSNPQKVKNRKPIETQNLNSSSTKGRKIWTHHTKGKWWDRHRTHQKVENLSNKLSTSRKFLVYVEDMLSRAIFLCFIFQSAAPLVLSFFFLLIPTRYHKKTMEKSISANALCQVMSSEWGNLIFG
jgi:hypothetical protein